MTSMIRSIPTRPPLLRSISSCYTQGCSSNPSSSGAVRTFTTTTCQKGKSNRSSSSERWLERHATDPYVRALRDPHVARSLNLPPSIADTSFISRSAFKLYEMQRAWTFLLPTIRDKTTRVILDLGASPGGWTQMALHLIEEQKREFLAKEHTPGDRPLSPAKVISLDRLPLDDSVASRPDVDFLQGNFFEPDTQRALADKIAAWRRQEDPKVLSYFAPSVLPNRGGEHRADVILSDMMANTSDSKIRNKRLSLDLLVGLYQFAHAHLAFSQSSCMIIKVFDPSPASLDFKKKYFQSAFKVVQARKAASSRSQSTETYWLCRGFQGGISVDEEDL